MSDIYGLWLDPKGEFHELPEEQEHFYYILDKVELEEFNTFYGNSFRVQNNEYKEELATNAMLRSFREGWIRIRGYEEAVSIHGYRIHSSAKRGRIRRILNYLLENFYIIQETKIMLLTEEESY